MIYQFPDFKVIAQHRNLLKNSTVIGNRIKMFEDHADRTIFSSCHSNDGSKLSAEKRKDILAYLNEPTYEKWDKIYKCQMFPNKSLWDSWNKVSTDVVSFVVDIDNPHAKWRRIPTPEELVLGIAAIKKNEREKLINIKVALDNNTLDLEFKFRNYLLKYA